MYYIYDLLSHYSYPFCLCPLFFILPQYIHMIDASVQKYFRNKDNLSMTKIMNFSFFYNLTKPTHLHPKGLKVTEEGRKS